MDTSTVRSVEFPMLTFDYQNIRIDRFYKNCGSKHLLQWESTYATNKIEVNKPNTNEIYHLIRLIIEMFGCCNKEITIDDE